MHKLFIDYFLNHQAAPFLFSSKSFLAFSLILRQRSSSLYLSSCSGVKYIYEVAPVNISYVPSGVALALDIFQLLITGWLKDFAFENI